MKKINKIFKIFLTVGIIASAVLAVAAIFFRMQKRLQEISYEQCLDNDDEDASCGGSCAECGMCDSDDDEIDVTVDEDEI